MKFNIHHFQSLHSTLDTAAEPTYAHLDVVLADFQSAGRGQRGNKWHSKAGENLMFSLVIEPTSVAVNEQFVISMLASIAAADAIESHQIEHTTIKWPNDIYVGNQKICGILIEHSFSSEYLAKSVLGIGINVAQKQFSPDSGNPTSLHLLGAQQATPSDLLDRFLARFAQLYSLTHQELHDLYMSRLYRRNGFFAFRDAQGEFSAQITTIDPHSGVITLTDTQALSRQYYFKEVSYI